MSSGALGAVLGPWRLVQSPWRCLPEECAIKGTAVVKGWAANSQGAMAYHRGPRPAMAVLVQESRHNSDVNRQSNNQVIIVSRSKIEVGIYYEINRGST